MTRRHPDGRATAMNECGDEVGFSLWEDEGVLHARADVAGCAVTAACARAAAALAHGLPPEDALARMTCAELMAAVASLPPGEEHAAEFVVQVMRAALRDLLVTRSAPWQRLYRR